MDKFKIICLVICILALGFFTNTAFAKKVVVVSGASQGMAKEIGYSLIYDGINEGLDGSGAEVVYQWVNLDKIKDEAGKEAAGQAAIAKARAEKPDVIIVLNDDCLKYVGLKIDDIPIIFAWVFTNTKAFPELPKANVTGVIRRSYAADIWGLANKLMGVKTVALISKHSASMAGVRQYLFALADKIEAGTGVRYKEMYLVDTFEEWEKTVNTFPEDIIYLADTSRVTKGDKVLTRTETTAWTVANAKVPVIAATEVDVAAGALYSIVTSEKAIGQHAADVTKKILAGTPPSEIKYAQSKKGKLVFNMKTAQQYKLEIPYDILSSADKIYE